MRTAAPGGTFARGVAALSISLLNTQGWPARMRRSSPRLSLRTGASFDIALSARGRSAIVRAFYSMRLRLMAQASATTPPNRLAQETSPYLQQHAHNPVDWYPWGPEALERAKKEGKPILLSVGYSACHWCHVMAHESFEDEATARLMNELFVNVKVDREERPDIDRIYQLAQQLITQKGGGWPLTMFLSHEDQRPFFGGTYFPKEPRYGMPAFRSCSSESPSTTATARPSCASRTPASCKRSTSLRRPRLRPPAADPGAAAQPAARRWERPSTAITAVLAAHRNFRIQGCSSA